MDGGLTRTPFGSIKPAMSDPRVVRLDRLALRFAPRSWPFAVERRVEIDGYFASLRRERPSLWNGRVLLAYDLDVADQVLRANFFETDFASFLAWRDWDFADRSVTNCFAMAAIGCSDGAFLLGVMGDHTSNPGHVYFPSGTPDPADIAGDGVDFERSVWRETEEETGLSRDDLDAEAGWRGVLAGSRVAVIKILRSRQDAATTRARILTHLARDDDPELSGIRVVRSTRDFDAQMPDFVTAFLRHMWK